MAQAIASIEASAKQAAPRGLQRKLTLARVAWALLVSFNLVMFVASLGPSFDLFRQPCKDANGADCATGQASLADWRAMQAHGITPDAYALYTLAVIVVASLIFFAVGFLIAWRKWNDMAALFVSATLITFGATGISDTLTNSAGLFGIAQFVIVVLSYPALATFMLTFPTGRFAPRWTMLIVLLWVIQFGLFVFGAPEIVLGISIVTTWGSCAVVQVYRYRRLYTPTQRQQTKWVVFSLALVIPLNIVFSILHVIWPALNAPGSLFFLTQILELALFWAPISLGVGIAILRSRLYDIDLLINRALVYGLLTAILGALYAVGVIGGQRFLSAVTGGSAAQESAPTIVLTTLLVAALFQPLRRRLQALIDRRFFRSRYNAARAVAGFSSAMRSEVHLQSLTDHLLDIVDETMRPEHVSLWLRPPERKTTDQRFNEAPAREP